MTKPNDYFEVLRSMDPSPGLSEAIERAENAVKNEIVRRNDEPGLGYSAPDPESFVALPPEVGQQVVFKNGDEIVNLTVTSVSRNEDGTMTVTARAPLVYEGPGFYNLLPADD